MKGNILQQKSFAFAINVVEVFKSLQNEKQEYVLSELLLRSGTRIGANIGDFSINTSDKQYLLQLTIANREACETIYWLKLLYATRYLAEKDFVLLHVGANEIVKLLDQMQTSIENRNS
ncbi:MAG: four helix bundle protein [Ferruginibacter sp.]|nr:four helix bundle protein [Ferruginibacter sp.]